MRFYRLGWMGTWLCFAAACSGAPSKPQLDKHTEDETSEDETSEDETSEDETSEDETSEAGVEGAAEQDRARWLEWAAEHRWLAVSAGDLQIVVLDAALNVTTTQVFDPASEQLGQYTVRWSPDGRHLAYVVQQLQSETQSAIVGDVETDIVVSHVVGAELWVASVGPDAGVPRRLEIPTSAFGGAVTRVYWSGNDAVVLEGVNAQTHETLYRKTIGSDEPAELLSSAPAWIWPSPRSLLFAEATSKPASLRLVRDSGPVVSLGETVYGFAGIEGVSDAHELQWTADMEHLVWWSRSTSSDPDAPVPELSRPDGEIPIGHVHQPSRVEVVGGPSSRYLNADGSRALFLDGRAEHPDSDNDAELFSAEPFGPQSEAPGRAVKFSTKDAYGFIDQEAYFFVEAYGRRGEYALSRLVIHRDGEDFPIEQEPADSHGNVMVLEQRWLVYRTFDPESDQSFAWIVDAENLGPPQLLSEIGGLDFQGPLIACGEQYSMFVRFDSACGAAIIAGEWATRGTGRPTVQEIESPWLLDVRGEPSLLSLQNASVAWLPKSRDLVVADFDQRPIELWLDAREDQAIQLSERPGTVLVPDAYGP